jgi:hypothetical protein
MNSLSFLHAQIYGEVAIYVNGLISLPLEVAKSAIDNILVLFWF